MVTTTASVWQQHVGRFGSTNAILVGGGMEKGEVVGLDVIGPIPSFSGPPSYIAVLVDHVSAYPWVCS